MSIANKIIPHYTYDDWIHWEGKWELIEGSPIAMSPSPIPAHQRALVELVTELTLALRKANCKNCRTYGPMDYKVSDDTILIPDVMIVCGEVKGKCLSFPPVLAIEILSPATALRDRHTKFEIYETEGVKFYLIVNVETQTIEFFELIDHEYKIQPGKKTFELETDCIIEPDFTGIFN